MSATTIVIWLFAISFILMSLAMLFAYRRNRHYGLFVMGMTYGASGAIALMLTDWWPLITGFIVVWLFKLIGLDPDRELPQRQNDDTSTDRNR